MNVVIIEDEPLSAQRLKTLLMHCEPLIQVAAILPSVEEAIHWFTHRPRAHQPDIVFMDIHLEDGSAFRIIEKLHLTIPIIFTTAYEHYAIQAFKANSIDYLLKPIDEIELKAAIDKFRWTQQKEQPGMSRPVNWSALLNWRDYPEPVVYKNRFMVTVGPKLKSIDVAEIAYFFYEDKTTYLTTQSGKHSVIEYSLDKISTLLNPHQFFRVSRAYLVSLGAIQSIHTFSGSKLKLELTPAPRHEVFVSTNRVNDFKTWLGK